MKVRFEYGAFGAQGIEDLEARLMLGAVDFSFIKVEDGSLRQARGTRDLSYPSVNWDLLPMNVRSVPPHILTFIDLDKGKWRCLRRANLIWYSDEVEIPDEII